MSEAWGEVAVCGAVLRAIFAETLAAVDAGAVFERVIRCSDGRLFVDDLVYEPAAFERVIVIGVGKAAVPSVRAAVRQLRACVSGRCLLQAIVVGPGGAADGEGDEIEYWPGSHPVPDAMAREAAARVCGLLRGAGSRDLVLFLISGGASAMLELPLDASLTVEEMAAFYRELVHSGLTIAEMNTLRKHASAVKGGRLAELARGAVQCTLLVSDVPEGMADVVGSGPSLPDASTREQCWELLRKPELEGRLPARVRAFLESGDLPETPKAGDACFARAEFRVVLSTETMLREAAQRCEARGFFTVVDTSCDEWEYRRAAESLLSRLRELLESHERVCVVSGGEVSVRIEGECGCGGRNQQFALYCATRLEGFSAEVAVLSAGTDGVDGSSPAAGAVVDAMTVQRARAAGLAVEEALRRFDGSPLLMRIGDAIVTGPTGNNVRDLRILMGVRRGNQGSSRSRW